MQLPSPVDDDFPILGEPLAVELANTRYGAGAEAVDFLSDDGAARRWATLVAGASPVDDLPALRELRDAAWHLLAARSAGRPLPRRFVDVVNRHAASGCAHVELVVSPRGGLSSRIQFCGPESARARFATSCVEVLLGPEGVRRCEGPGCTLFFVPQHGRRRFCHESCSHRARQERYRRSQK